MRKPKNSAEAAFFVRMATDGWELLKSGWPDFACFKGERFGVVEVKPKHNHPLKRAQKKVMLALEAYGVPCYRWDPVAGFQQVTTNSKTARPFPAQLKREQRKAWELAAELGLGGESEGLVL
jgi:hypothetical protein